ncbi:MAG: stearoyl-CoA desaturase (delta-9 desaturase), partial [Glaciecola sp.]
MSLTPNATREPHVTSNNLFDEPAAPAIRGVVDPTATESRVQKYGVLAITLVPFIGLTLAIIGFWGWGVTARDLWIALGMYIVSGLGITVGYHRLLTHKSFDAPPWVRAGWAAAGSLAVQGSCIDWVATHRRHHAYSDRHGDPHSPHIQAEEGFKGTIKGLFHSHVGWLWRPSGTVHQTWAPDLIAEPGVAAVNRSFPWIVVFSFTFPAALGFVLSGGNFAAALTAFLWGSLARIFLLHHVTWSINSVCHFWGTRPFESRDQARNNPVMGLLAFGEGWHNAHHAFPASARHGLRWWE